jgi:hypothetical protein
MDLDNTGLRVDRGDTNLHGDKTSAQNSPVAQLIYAIIGSLVFFIFYGVGLLSTIVGAFIGLVFYHGDDDDRQRVMDTMANMPSSSFKFERITPMQQPPPPPRRNISISVD